MSASPRTRAPKHAASASTTRRLVALLGSLSLMLIGLVGTVTAMSAPASAVTSSIVQADDQVSSDQVSTEQNKPKDEQSDPCKDNKKGVKSGSREGCGEPDPCKDDKAGLKSGSREGCGEPDPCKDQSILTSGGGSNNEHCNPDPCKDVVATSSSTGGQESGHGKCKAEATWPLEKPICVPTDGDKMNVVVKVTGVGTGTGKTQAEADAEALANAKTNADVLMTAALAQYEGYKDGVCVWTAETTFPDSASFCSLNGNPPGSSTVPVPVTLNVTGVSGVQESIVSQADADTKALNAAKASAASQLTAASAPFTSQQALPCPVPSVPVTPSGGTPPSVTTTSVPPAPAVVAPVAIVPAPAEVAPVPVVVTPQAGTTPVKPQAGTVPEAATIPSAVPAGGGSSAPTGVPMWALMLLVVGALGAAGAGFRMAGARK